MNRIRPELLELVRRELDVLVVVTEGVKLVGLLVSTGPKTRGGEVLRSGDDVAGLVFVEAFRKENVDLGVEAFRRMGADFDLL